MPDVKLVVIYPQPKDVEAFEKVYQNEHVPMAVAKLVGKTKIVAGKVLSSPQGTPPFHRIVEVHFSIHAGAASMRRVRRREADPGPCRHLSSGGSPIFLIAEEQTFTFDKSAKGA